MLPRVIPAVKSEPVRKDISKILEDLGALQLR